MDSIKASSGRAAPRTREDLDAMFARVMASGPHRVFGLAIDRWEAGESHLFFHAEETAFDPRGEVHGGVLSLLLEPAAMVALAPMLPADHYAVTVAIQVQFLRPVRPRARVELVGKVRKAGRTMAFCEAQAFDDGRLCVSAAITKSVFRME
ncbi:MAG: PaaI family thioesterase [Caulobacteraceae bacterium]|nr:PaaI family thioesterase [Caulobacteraceae bacterium]